MENGEWRITVRVFCSPFLFIGCYFMAYIYIICTIYAVGCAKVNCPKGKRRCPGVRPRRTAFQRISPDYSPWHTLSLMYSVAVKFALRFTNGAPSRRTLRDSVSLYLSVSIFAGMYRIGKLLSTASYPLTNPNLTAIILKLIHKCREKEEYFSFARLERVRSVQAPRRGRRRSLWSRTAEFSLSCSV